jgi:radical SAM protein with 4Fe4S-binding SPASM domain
VSRSQEDLTPKDMERILTLFPNLKYVNLQGLGETFLNRDLEEIMLKLQKKNIKSWTVSNGTLLTKERVRKLIHNYFFDIAISLDSADINKAGELRPGGPDLNIVIEGVETLIKERDAGASNVLVGFNVTVSHENYNELAMIADLAVRVGVDYILIANIENWFLPTEEGYGQAKEFADKSLKEMEKIEYAVQQLRSRLRFSPVIVRHYKSSKRIGNCSWPFSSMFIAVDGSVTPCCIRMHTSTYSFGNIHNCNSLEEIWHGQQYSDLRQAHFKKDNDNLMCGRCPL